MGLGIGNSTRLLWTRHWTCGLLYKVGNLLTSWATVSFLVRTLVMGSVRLQLAGTEIRTFPSLACHCCHANCLQTVGQWLDLLRAARHSSTANGSEKSPRRPRRILKACTPPPFLSDTQRLQMNECRQHNCIICTVCSARYFSFSGPSSGRSSFEKYAKGICTFSFCR